MERLGGLELFGIVGDVAGADDAKDTTAAAGNTDLWLFLLIRFRGFEARVAELVGS
jgi:hypothetical protein